jgi:hypothetical protein
MLRAEVVQLISNLLCVHALNTDAKERDLPSIISQFLNIFKTQLVSPYTNRNDFILKSQILKSYTSLYLRAPKLVEPAILEVVPYLWDTLTYCAEQYIPILSMAKLPPRDESEASNLPHFYNLVYNTFALMYALISNHKAIDEIGSVLSDLIFHFIIFMTIAPEIETQWLQDDEAFITDEAGNFDLSVRNAGKELLIVSYFVIGRNNLMNYFISGHH